MYKKTPYRKVTNQLALLKTKMMPAIILQRQDLQPTYKKNALYESNKPIGATKTKIMPVIIL